MRDAISVVARILSKVTGNGVMQAALEKNLLIAQYLMGIGAGTDVASSGERAIFKMLASMYRAPYCIFDVGANHGQFLNVALKAAPSDTRFHCFEPSRTSFDAISLNFGSNPRVELNNVGVGKEIGTAALHANADGSGLASLTKRRLTHFGIDFDRVEEVTLTTIDQYCATNAIERIHLLKIDIEGHEMDALVGAAQMFAKRAIGIVAFEFGGCNIDTRTFFQDFWYFFAEQKMRLFRITPSGYMRLVASYREIHEQFRTTNFVAVAGK